MFIDNNLIIDVWKYPRLALATSAKTLFILLGYSEEELRKIPLSIDYYHKSLYSYSRKQLDYNIFILGVQLYLLLLREEKRF